MADKKRLCPGRRCRPTPDPVGLSPNEALGHYVSLWKTSVEVQQHFNDIEWRIRGLAVTVATSHLGPQELQPKTVRPSARSASAAPSWCSD